MDLDDFAEIVADGTVQAGDRLLEGGVLAGSAAVLLGLIPLPIPESAKHAVIHGTSHLLKDREQERKEHLSSSCLK